MVSKYAIGTIHQNKQGDKFKVVELDNKRYCYIEFLDTGYRKRAQYANIWSGTIKDMLKPSIYGVGIPSMENPYKNHKVEYKLWHHMLGRAYDPKYHKTRPTYKDVEVCERWKRFDLFLEDLPKIENYGLWVFDSSYQLDKDFSGKKVYSLETCKFLPMDENIGIRKGKPQRNSNTIEATDPNGKKYVFNNQNAFARKYNLDSKAINNCIKGRLKTHRKWTFKLK